MFKRTLNTILLALTLAFSVNAGSVSGYPIGYCNGEAGTSSKLKFDGEDKEVSAAIYIPSTYAATVAGNSVDAIRVALWSAKVSTAPISPPARCRLPTMPRDGTRWLSTPPMQSPKAAVASISA